MTKSLDGHTDGNSQEESMPIKKTNLSMFLEEVRNETEVQGRRNNVYNSIQLSQQGNSLKLDRLANAPIFQVK